MKDKHQLILFCSRLAAFEENRY